MSKHTLVGVLIAIGVIAIATRMDVPVVTGIANTIANRKA